MMVHARRDHSLRIPRPDLTVKLGTPNACNACHKDRSPQWAAAALEKWYGPATARSPHYGEVIAAGRAGGRDGEAGLITLAGDQRQPAIVRATALYVLRGHGPAGAATMVAATKDEDPAVRAAAAAGLVGLPEGERLAAAAPLLKDPIRGVRIEAARALASVPADRFDAVERQAFDAALAEFKPARDGECRHARVTPEPRRLSREPGPARSGRAVVPDGAQAGPLFRSRTGQPGAPLQRAGAERRRGARAARGHQAHARAGRAALLARAAARRGRAPSRGGRRAGRSRPAPARPRARALQLRPGAPEARPAPRRRRRRSSRPRSSIRAIRRSPTPWPSSTAQQRQYERALVYAQRSAEQASPADPGPRQLLERIKQQMGSSNATRPCLDCL